MLALLPLLIMISLIIGWMLASHGVQHLHMAAWKRRRGLHLFMLTMPVLLLCTSMSGVESLMVYLCPSVMVPWDAWSGKLFPLVVSVIALGALGWGCVRLVFMTWWLKQQQLVMDPQLQATVDTLVQKYSFPPVQARLTSRSLPLAFTTGMRQPQIVLSTWIIQHLDQAEVEAVLMHELEHISHWDYLFTWITTVLRDAFFYLPTSRQIYHQIQWEKELLCDQQVVQRTRRPLALASALTKVWLYTVNPQEMPLFHMAQSLTGRHAEMQTRVERLLCLPSAEKVQVEQMERKRQRKVALLGVVFCLQGFTILIILVLLGCLPFYLSN